jgi:hypothetical protein
MRLAAGWWLLQLFIIIFMLDERMFKRSRMPVDSPCGCLTTFNGCLKNLVAV